MTGDKERLKPAEQKGVRLTEMNLSLSPAYLVQEIIRGHPRKWI
jgi:hypothetical protein